MISKQIHINLQEIEIRNILVEHIRNVYKIQGISIEDISVQYKDDVFIGYHGVVEEELNPPSVNKHVHRKPTPNDPGCGCLPYEYR